jgi:hypothetical protein
MPPEDGPRTSGRTFAAARLRGTPVMAAAPVLTWNLLRQPRRILLRFPSAPMSAAASTTVRNVSASFSTGVSGCTGAVPALGGCRLARGRDGFRLRLLGG